MIDYNDFYNLVCNIVRENHFNNIVSIYSYGSISQGNFEKKYSDADLWFIIECKSIQERISLVKEMSAIIDCEIKKYLDKVHNVKKDRKYHYHGSLFFTEIEFEKYYNSYPTRVIYPIKKKIWKLIYGKDLLEKVEIPDRKTCVEHLQYDFEVFVHEFNKLSFSINTRDMIKYFLRAIQTVIWILKDIYLPCIDEVLEKADVILSDDKLLPYVIEKIKYVKSISYKLSGVEYLELFLNCSTLLEIYGKKINCYVCKNGYSLLDINKFIETTIWGCLAWDMACLISGWCNMINKKSKMTLLEFLEGDGYKKRMQYFNYIITRKLRAEEVDLSVWDMPAMRSRILNPIQINKDIYKDIIDIPAYMFLIEEHMNNIINKKFSKMNISQLIEYAEKKYIPAVYEVFERLLRTD